MTSAITVATTTPLTALLLFPSRTYLPHSSITRSVFTLPSMAMSRTCAIAFSCGGSTAAFAVALFAMWVAFAMLVTALSLPDLFWLDIVDNGGSAELGMWRVCVWDLPGYWDSTCDLYGGADGFSMDDAWIGQGDTFNAMRTLTLIAAITTFVAGILAAIRLAFQQRVKPIPPTLSWTLVASAMLALCAAAAAWALSMMLYNSLQDSSEFYASDWIVASRGDAWSVLTAGFIALVVGVPLHVIAHYFFQRRMRLLESTQCFVVYPASPSHSQSPFNMQPSKPPPVSYGPVVTPLYLTYTTPTEVTADEPGA